MEKTYVSLALVDRDYVAVVFKASTGIEYSNQVGGLACSHPVVEGFLVPLSVSGPEEDPWLEIAPQPYKEKHMGRTEALLCELCLEDSLEAPTVEEAAAEGITQVGEAWVPVKVKEQGTGWDVGRFGPLENLKGRIGILTYPNSD